jgi:hypothetical protein
VGQPSKQPLRWSQLRGYNTRNTPQSLPDDIGTVCTNVELIEGALGRRRPSLTALSLTGGPTGNIEQFLVHAPSATTAELWAISGGGVSLTGHRYRVGSGWSSVSFIDTPIEASHYHVVGATLNDKFFLAYNSGVNRLHTWTGTEVRRVGIVPSAAPTVANSAAGGAYAATARYYRVAWRIKSGSVVKATSELSPAVSFTPGGASAAATITKPTTPDSATHWVLYGLIGTAGDTYDLYEELAETAVGTTTVDDSTAPASYDGDRPMELGINIPPPSCKYVVSDGSRLIMAGVHETSAAAGQTEPLEGFVYFTRKLGASDQGDDETVPNSATLKYRLPVGQSDGDIMVGLGGPIDGIVYVFKTRSIWRLIPTGIDTAPYTADLLTGGVGAAAVYYPLIGATAHNSIVAAQDAIGRPVLYFNGYNGPYRISPSGGVEYVGGDITLATTGRGPRMFAGIWHRDKRQVWWVDAFENKVHVYSPHLATLTPTGWSGGWSLYSFGSITAPHSLAMFDVTASANGTSSLVPIVGGILSAAASAGSADAVLATDAGVAFTATATSKPFLMGGGFANVSCDSPILEGECESGATPTVALVIDHGRETRSGASPALTAIGSETRKAVTVESIEAADAQVVQIKVTWDSDQTKAIDAVTVPYKVQERR